MSYFGNTNIDGSKYVEVSSSIRICNPRTAFEYYDDAIYPALDWDLRALGVGSSCAVFPVDSAHPGTIKLDLGTTNVGNCSAAIGPGQTDGLIFPGGGKLSTESYIYINALATVGDDYFLYAGLMNGWVFGNPIDGCYFLYNRSTSLNWIIVQNNNGTATSTTTSIPVTAGWHGLRAVCNGSASTDYYIDGVLAGTINTNFPVTRSIGMGMLATKTAGTTDTFFYIDYVYLFEYLTNTRGALTE